MAGFKRGIDMDRMRALKDLAAVPGWWRDVLNDKSVVIGIRDNYLNAYWRGQSILMINITKSGKVSASTHPKYIVNPDAKNQISLDAASGKFQFDPDVLLIRQYVPGETLEKLKRAAKRYSGREKRGVQEIAEANPNLVDVEIAFRQGADSVRVPRIDFATFEEGKDGVNLAFWEAKYFGNPELSDDEDSGVIAQIGAYEKFIRDNNEHLVKSYSLIAKNIVDISEMSNGIRRTSPLVQRVAKGDGPIVHINPEVRLVIFGYTESQKRENLSPLLERFSKILGQNRCIARGSAKGMRLRLRS